MSFGWSAGDIAQAISLIVKVVKALDDGSGAPDEYRKMAVFLESVNLTLKNLHVFASLGVYPSNVDEIHKMVENIRPPLERFIDEMKKFERHLGSNATPGWWKNIPQKMLWTFKRSHHQLKKEIKEHAFMLDNLLNRFTLEVVLNLPEEFKQVFMNTLTPQMVSVLQGMLDPVRSEISIIRSEGREQHKEQYSKAEEIILLLQSLNYKIDASKPENNASLDAAVRNIKEHITSTLRSMSINSQMPIISSFSQRPCNAESPPASNLLFQAMNIDPLEASDEEIKQSLRNILYLANGLKLSRPLTPNLLGIYHITFHDALGRPPRVLQIDIFNNFQIFQVFLHQSFHDTIGKPWVERGSYFLANRSDNAALTADTWSRIVKPGCHVEMAMLLDYMSTAEKRCPNTGCPGVLTSISGSTPKKCLTCQTDIREFKVAGANEGYCTRSLERSIDLFKKKKFRTSDTADLDRRDHRLAEPPASQAKEPLKQQDKFEFEAPFSTTQSEDSSRLQNPVLKFDILPPDLSLKHTLELQDDKPGLGMESSTRPFKNISKPQNQPESNTKTLKIQSRPDLLPQQSNLKSDTEPSTQPFVIASELWKSRVCIWSCCWCRDSSGNYTSSGITTQIISCQACCHVRCVDCHVEWVEIRHRHHG
ncbi:hypothetical protein BofuT4_P095870.1 [Botrytis cinerea T4]|uniref:Ubiquitin-like domain-containing protein n=1 Tax=Botryotinia fuckeliana (strain T4) TaxID=999810 RepID=G2YDN1_BOTF4|nr:hypothetical protein BofuT4_P095870.1 [Botrytis cinerea T4]